MTLLVVALLAGALGFVAMRVLGARETRGDHPGERGYVHFGPRDEV